MYICTYDTKVQYKIIYSYFRVWQKAGNIFKVLMKEISTNNNNFHSQ